MISTLVDLLGNYYASNDLISFEAAARSIHAVIPGDTISLQFLGLAYYRTGRITDAKGVFDALVKHPVAVFDKCRRKAVVANSADDSAIAECYKEATRKRPVLARVWYDLGVVLLEVGTKELAAGAFRSAMRANPDDALAAQALLRAERGAVSEAGNEDKIAPEAVSSTA